MGPPLEKDEEKRRKQLSRSLKRMNGMLTPMSKYYCSEMCNRAAYDAIQVLGGSGYMKDYAAERYARDARITTIYEGTSQLQVVAAVRGVTSGSLDTWAEPHEKRSYGDPLLDGLKEKLIEARQRVAEAVQFVKIEGRVVSRSVRPPAGRFGASTVIIGHLLLGQGGGQRAEEARRPAVHRPRTGRAADELRTDPRRRHVAAGRVRPAGRARAGGKLTPGLTPFRRRLCLTLVSQRN